MIRHHNFFKIHLPKKNYNGDDENELTEILMEEFYLLSDGDITKSYKSINPKKDKLEISIFPSIVYAANKLKHTEGEKFQFINDYIDNSFVDYLQSFNPLYKCTSFIDYHLHFFKGNREDFFKHIKYQILAIVKRRKEKGEVKFDYESLEIIIKDWLKIEMEKDANSNVSKKRNYFSNEKIGLYSLIITAIGIIVSIIIGWEDILKLFK